MATPAPVLEKPEPAYTSYAAFVTLHTPCLHIMPRHTLHINTPFI